MNKVLKWNIFKEKYNNEVSRISELNVSVFYEFECHTSKESLKVGDNDELNIIECKFYKLWMTYRESVTLFCIISRDTQNSERQDFESNYKHKFIEV